jgi:GTP cyclohydrolase IA
MADAVRVLLTEVGEDIERQGLVKTPMRMARAFKFFTSGYHLDLKRMAWQWHGTDGQRD